MNHDLINSLIQYFAKMPGLGPRSARRLVLYLLNNKERMEQVARIMLETASLIAKCKQCGNISYGDECCEICLDINRDHKIICVVEDVVDLWAMERGGSYKGLYHVLGGTLSALDGMTPDKLHIPQLIERVSHNNIQEVILATGATLSGQTTAHYIAEALQPYHVTISRLAHGIPMGAELDYLDDGTLALSLKSRQLF